MKIETTESSNHRLPETSALLQWVMNEKEKGLIDVKFCPGKVTGESVESFAREANNIQNAEVIADDDLI